MFKGDKAEIHIKIVKRHYYSWIQKIDAVAAMQQYLR